jgi:hypothetical protein
MSAGGCSLAGRRDNVPCLAILAIFHLFLVVSFFDFVFVWIPVVSQGVDCFCSVGLGCSWTFTVIIFNDQCGSTLFVSMYISFA